MWSPVRLLTLALITVGCAQDGADSPADAGNSDAAADQDASVANDASRPAKICSSCGDCEESVAAGTALHVIDPVEYTDPPPVGGNHDPCWADFGVHEEAVAPERWVHNLEHGGVAFLYHCPGGCDAEVAMLASLSTNQRPFALVTEYAALPARFAAVAWGHRLVTDCFDAAAFGAFYDAHADQAPESSTSGRPPACDP